VTKLSNYARKAAKNAANLMTFEVRKKAKDNGWEEDVVNSIKVSFQNDKYQLSISNNFTEKAMDLEYGTTRSRPTAAIRKFANNTSKAEAAIIKGLEQELGVTL
jgi:hypothetical protein